MHQNFGNMNNKLSENAPRFGAGAQSSNVTNFNHLNNLQAAYADDTEAKKEGFKIPLPYMGPDLEDDLDDLNFSKPNPPSTVNAAATVTGKKLLTDPLSLLAAQKKAREAAVSSSSSTFESNYPSNAVGTPVTAANLMNQSQSQKQQLSFLGAPIADEEYLGPPSVAAVAAEPNPITTIFDTSDISLTGATNLSDSQFYDNDQPLTDSQWMSDNSQQFGTPGGSDQDSDSHGLSTNMTVS